MTLREILLEAGAIRFKPILLTALVIPAIYIVMRDADKVAGA